MNKAVLAMILISAIVLRQPLPARTQSAQPATPPERVLVGAYDAAQVNGLAFITGYQNSLEQNCFGLRFLAYRLSGTGVEVDESPRSFDLGSHAPDGSFARVSWQPQFDPKTTVTLRWSRVGKRIVVGQLSSSANVSIAIEAYRPWSDGRDGASWGTFAAQGDKRSIFGDQIHNQKSKPPLGRFLLRADRAATGSANYNDARSINALLAKADQVGGGKEPAAGLPASRSALIFDLSQNSPLGFIAAVGEEFDSMQRDADAYGAPPAAEVLDNAEKGYVTTRAMTGGALGESLEAINRATMWNRFYSFGLRYEYVSGHRHSGRGLRGDVLGWDSLLAATMASLTDGGAATASLRVLLAGQTPDGRVPLRRYMQTEPAGEPPILAGRSMPPLGALAVLKVYLATQDLEFLAWAYPRLRHWNDWWHSNRGDGKKWRDGNADGLLEWGFDAEQEYGSLGARSLTNADKHRLALAEAGPLATGAKYNDEAHTLEMSSVALNSLYALDTELMIFISREIGLVAEADRWQVRYDGIKRLINEQLWSEPDGLYLDKQWDEKFSRRVTLESFYPLIAGIPDEARAKRMLAVLGDRQKFWGDHLLPSIARDDPAFAKNAAEQTAATGAIQAATNYLLYLGLKRYGFHDEAAELARKSTAMGRAAFERNGESSERGGSLFDLFAAATGRPIEDQLVPQRVTFSGLIFLPGVEELISTDPWSGMTVGSQTATDEARIERVKMAGASLDVIVGPKRTVVRRNGKVEIEFEGPVRMRSYRSNNRALAFLVETREEVRALTPAVDGVKITASVDDKVLGSTSPGAAASFKVKEGTHKVLIVK